MSYNIYLENINLLINGGFLMTKADQFYNELKGKKIAFIGTGVSHTELIKKYLKKGFDITVCDKKMKEKFNENLYSELEVLGAKFSLGDNYLDAIFSCDIIFRTPGMYFNNPALIKAREMGVVVTSEMETFFNICPCKIYAVTGSDGKTTTTTLISEFLKAEGKTVYLGGNIGKPLLCRVDDIKESDVAVVELSSFQLLSMRESPDVAVITNIAPNHLDVHGTMEEYIGSKCNIIAHQNAFSKTVLNYDNEPTMKLKNIVRGHLLTFSRHSEVPNGAFLNKDGDLCFSDHSEITKIMNMTEIKIPGIHNVENYLTAISAVWDDVSIESIKKVAREFGGVEHRIEFVREFNGVKWYNDSIATSPTRVLAGLASFDQKLIVIAGGYDKKIPFEPLAKSVNDRVKILILLGVTAKKIETAVTSYEGYDSQNLKIVHVNSMEEAVSTAQSLAISGDIVTLSPACASFDMYPNFEVRGEHFKRLVSEL